ncbi:hypothetical protein AB0J01_37780 [Streptomyces sp. NPDC050204]|uniref:hypothetical protein n=1 Tax=Streptomyces sp. NPDC050204 TaxID=3155514 RepID=UPI003422989B
MSVTFTAALRPPVGYVVGCGCAEAVARAPRYGTYADAREAADRANAAPGTRRALPGCALPAVCPDYPLFADEVDPDGEVPCVNLSNANALGVLEALGLPVGGGGADADALEPGLPADVPDGTTVIPIVVVDAYGELPAPDFLARAVTALGLAPEDPGVPDLQVGCTLVGGRAPGYLQRRLLDLYGLAAWCAAHGRDVAWY